jgi:hypothetical protein
MEKLIEISKKLKSSLEKVTPKYLNEAMKCNCKFCNNIHEMYYLIIKIEEIYEDIKKEI